MDEHHYTSVVPLPVEVSDWLLDFDGNRPVEPISFTLALPGGRKVKDRTGHSSRRKAAMPAVK